MFFFLYKTVECAHYVMLLLPTPSLYSAANTLIDTFGLTWTLNYYALLNGSIGYNRSCNVLLLKVAVY